MTGNSFSLYSSILLFLCIFDIGSSLECYTCNTTASALYDDPCKGIGSLVKCQEPAMCLSATYNFEDPQSKIAQYTVVKSCYPTMGGKECKQFEKHIQLTSPYTNGIQLTNDCYTCEEEGCNQRHLPTLSKAPLMMAVPAFISLSICSFISRLM